MHEVINFSCSQASGHLITQLYNVQESHLPYTRDKQVAHSNDVFLVPRRLKGKSNYYPRSLNIEFSGGFGYLGKYEYSGGQKEIDGPEVLEGVVVQKQARQEKNEYQKRLDSGKATSPDLLSTENTTYWTDYNKLIYRPESLISLGGFSHPEGTHKNFPRLKFDTFQVGAQEFKASGDEIDDFFRKNLEESDQIQGVNFFSECDNGWAGFTSEMMIFLRDEYFGNGVSSKYNLWAYGLMGQLDGPMRTERMLTRIRAVTECASNSTLFMPLLAPQEAKGLLSPAYDPQSLWHRGAVESLFVNSIWGLNSQVQSSVSMATIEENLLRGNSKRNIVNEICLKEENVKKSPESFGIVSDINIMDMYLSGGRKPAKAQRDFTLTLGLCPLTKDQDLSRGVVCKEQPESGLSDSITDTYVNKHMDEISQTDSFPDILECRQLRTEFAQTKSLKPVLKDYRKIVDRVRLKQHLDILGEKSEVIETLWALIEEYTVGYSDESDYDEFD